MQAKLGKTAVPLLCVRMKNYSRTEREPNLGLPNDAPVATEIMPDETAGVAPGLLLTIR